MAATMKVVHQAAVRWVSADQAENRAANAFGSSTTM